MNLMIWRMAWRNLWRHPQHVRIRRGGDPRRGSAQGTDRYDAAGGSTDPDGCFSRSFHAAGNPTDGVSRPGSEVLGILASTPTLLIVTAVLVVAYLGLLWAAMARFQRTRLILD